MPGAERQSLPEQSDGDARHRCPSCGRPTRYQAFSGGREWYCEGCGNHGSFPGGVAPGRAGLLTTHEGRERLRAEVRAEISRCHAGLSNAQ